MSWFTSKAEVPQTISDEEMAGLSKRARGRGEPMFSKKAIEQRKASAGQKEKSRWS
jgi:hypothetical protein